ATNFDALQGAGAISAEQRAALEPYVQIRQATATDLITLSAGAILGKTVGGNPLLVNGVSVPLADQYVLIPSETAAIRARVTAFNNIISTTVANSNNRVALADINATLSALATFRADVVNGVTITPSFAPPTGGFSEDGVHPNSRGYAYLANVFVTAINAKFGASVPLVNISKYSATSLPITP
ncbi:MAG: G-D-S-L family lipolytic protein, partial [Bacteroidia bacterium]|nr:G-D-S-L family lipolytic protein [Bacteroidia bacterium]